MSKKIVYLCGGINNLSDSECIKWREEAKRLLTDYKILDPMSRDYRGQESGHIAPTLQEAVSWIYGNIC